ncbi:MAG: ferric reductase-like transmembrane domain-containing protein [Anaerolineales bacterium]|nr:ferric reductase-like transmembrane domain-containing protein [Anaerolineales bacterium]
MWIERLRRMNWWRVTAHVIPWALLIWLGLDYLTGNLTVNPIQAATQRSGKYAVILLLASLACTPLNTLFGWRGVNGARRALGLYAFLFALLHFTLFAGVDFGFDLNLLKRELVERRYIWVGLPALLILTALAATSFKSSMKRMGKNWKRLHRLVYLAGVLVVVHVGWAKKGDFLRLQGDIGLPLLFGSLLLLLLFLRLPVVRKAISAGRGRIQRRSVSLTPPE